MLKKYRTVEPLNVDLDTRVRELYDVIDDEFDDDSHSIINIASLA